MGKIILLDESTITKIAAGEVIERPFSVVKELVENSLDAGANEIIIRIKDSGKKQISVTDNGSGMKKEDLELCVKRHATSKIKDINDIYSILSYGFRGEALATISEVSKMEIISATKDSEVSYKLVLDSGKIKEILPDTKRQGTTINVYNLFYSVPARQKFLKSDSYEFKRISDWIKTIAIANPKISFMLYNDTKLVFNYKICNSISERIKEVFNLEVIESEYDDPILKSKVFFTNPTNLKESFSDTKQIFFVNNRPIINKTISFAIMKAFENIVPRGKKPNVFVFINISPKIVDVNVHPQKLEVRVKDDNTFFYPVYGALKKSLDKGFTEEKKTKIISLLGEEKNEINNYINKSFSENSLITTNTNTTPSSNTNTFNTQTQLNFNSNSISEKESFITNYKIIGQYDDTFIIIENRDGSLLIIDQHVAEERYLFEKLTKEYEENKSIKSQELIAPINFDFPLEYSNIIFENKDLFLSLGFDINFVKDSIIVRKIPIILGRIPDKEELKEFLLEIVNGNDISAKKDNYINKLVISILTNMSCKSAIKANTQLSIFEMKKIIDNLYSTKNPYTCPHGRPIIIELTKMEIYRKIGRK